jgi:hypothetical protein
MLGPATVNFLMGNRWYLTSQSQGYFLIAGLIVSLMGASVAKDDNPQTSLILLGAALPLLLLFWWLGWFYAVVAVMLVLGGVLWWLERRSKVTESLEQRR